MVDVSVSPEISINPFDFKSPTMTFCKKKCILITKILLKFSAVVKYMSERRYVNSQKINQFNNLYMSIQTFPNFICVSSKFIVDISQLFSSGSNGAFTPLLVDVEFIRTISKSRTIPGVRVAALCEKQPHTG